MKIDGFNPESQLYRHCCPTILRDSTLSSAWKVLFKDIEPDKEVSTTFEKLCGLPVKMCCKILAHTVNYLEFTNTHLTFNTYYCFPVFYYKIF